MLFAIGLPLARRRIKPNFWYGVRLGPTLKDESIWYDVNEKAGRELAVLGVCVVLLAALAPIASDSVLVNSLVQTSVLLVGTVFVAVRSVGLARRMWNERSSGSARS